MKSLRISLYLFDSFDDFLLEYLLALFHLVYLFLNWFTFWRGRGWAWCHSRVLCGLLECMTWGIEVASKSSIIGQLLVGRWDLLSLVIIESLSSIRIELGLILIALDHLLEMLFHGELTRSSRWRLNLFLVLFTNQDRIVVLLILHLLLINHLLSLIESVGRILLLIMKWLLWVFGGSKCLVFVQGEIELESLELFRGGTSGRATRLLLLLCLNSRATCWPIWIYDVWYRHRGWWKVLLHSLLLQIIGAFI